MNPFRIFPIITVKNDLAVQSYRYNQFRPLGSPLSLIKNYERWCVDEILINCIDATTRDKQPNFELVKSVSALKIRTPLTYGGGINSIEQAIKLIKSGCDRLLIECMFWRDPKTCMEIAKILGQQALILSLPVRKNDEKILRYDYISKRFYDIKTDDILRIEKTFSEVLFIDVQNEGISSSFSLDPNSLSLNGVGKILFGGISDYSQVRKFSQNNSVNGCAIGNFALHKELKVNMLRDFSAGARVRGTL